MDSVAYHIRPYRSSDHDAVLELHESALRVAGAFAEEKGDLDADLQNITDSYASGAFLVVELNGKLVGMGAYRRMNDDTAELKRMRTVSSLQGKGIGSALLRQLEVMIKEAGYKKIVLDTLDLPGKFFYEHHGYDCFAQQDGGAYTVLFYSKNI